MNNEGYRNLCKLVSLGYMEGFYYKPRIDKELLRELNGGLIALSACLQGEVSQALNYGIYEKAKAAAETYAAIFGDRYYIEIQDNKLAEQEKVNRQLVELAKELSIPVVATNDCHYGERADFHAHDVLLCVQTGKTVSDDNRLETRDRRALSQIRRRDEPRLRLLSGRGRAHVGNRRSLQRRHRVRQVSFSELHAAQRDQPRRLS